MTINAVSSSSAATQATQQAAKHKPNLDFAKLMVNAGDIKPDAAQSQGGQTASPVPPTGNINTTV